MTEGVRVFPERLNPENEEFQSAIEALSQPPERELTESDRFEVKSFEHALANGEVPFGLPLPDQIRQPEKTLREIYESVVREEKYCVDYFLQDELCEEYFPEATKMDPSERATYIPGEMARRIADPDRRPSNDVIDASKVFARKKIEANLKQLHETGSYNKESDPTYERGLRDPQKLLEKAQAAKSIKGYYRDIEKQMGLQSGANGELKQVLLRMHQERINLVLTGCYRDAMTLIRQDREGHILTEEQRDSLGQALPALRMKAERDTSLEAGFVDRESFARFYDRLDKFSRGVNREQGYGHIPDALQELRERYEFQAGIVHPHYTYEDIDPEVLKSQKVSAEQVKEMIALVLSEYGIFSEYDDFDPDSDEPADDKKWRVVIDPKTNRKSLSVDGKKRCVMLPQVMNRTLSQQSPAGVLPLIDHEVTHVLQHHNADRLNLELFETIGAARVSSWLEAGGVVWETVSQEALFGQDRRVNFTYLAAAEKRLEGGTVVECAEAFLEEAIRTEPEKKISVLMKTAANRAQRLFRDGGELTDGTPYLTSSVSLQYAEQKVLADQIPSDKRWLFYIGKSNLNTLSELYRLGWIEKDKLLLPERLPSDILEPYVRENILSKPGQDS